MKDIVKLVGNKLYLKNKWLKMANIDQNDNVKVVVYKNEIVIRKEK